MEGIFSGLCTMLQVRTLIHEVKLIILKSNQFLLSIFNNEFRKTYPDEFWTLFTAFFVKMSGLFWIFQNVSRTYMTVKLISRKQIIDINYDIFPAKKMWENARCSILNFCVPRCYSRMCYAFPPNSELKPKALKDSPKWVDIVLLGSKNWCSNDR